MPDPGGLYEGICAEAWLVVDRTEYAEGVGTIFVVSTPSGTTKVVTTLRIPQHHGTQPLVAVQMQATLCPDLLTPDEG